MKGIETWIWIVGGILLTMLLIGISVNIIYNVNLQQEKNIAELEFSKIVSTVNSLCDSNVGQEATHKLKFPEIVEKIYASYDKSFDTSKTITKGIYLCMNSTELKCTKLDCALQFPLIKRKESLISFIDRISGKKVYYEYDINFVREEEGVIGSITLSFNETTTTIKPETQSRVFNFETLIEFHNNPILIRNNNLTVFLDITPWIEKNENLIKIMENICSAYGNKIGIIWEDSCVWRREILQDGSIWCPNQANVSVDENEIIRRLRSKGCKIEIILHDKKLFSSMLPNYDQIWLLRPGWCEVSTNEFSRSSMDFCINSIKWDNVEVREIAQYAKNGRNVVMFLDYSPNINLRVANAILSNFKFYAKIIDGKTSSGIATKIYESEITSGITNYPVSSAAIIKPG